MFDSRMINCWLKPQQEVTGRVTFKHPWLKPGRYQLDLHIDSTSGLVDVLFNAAVFDVIDEMPYPGAFNAKAYRMGNTMANFSIDLGGEHFQTD
jgi:lipopolysaccharide transport system ATP-binding protein